MSHVDSVFVGSLIWSVSPSTFTEKTRFETIASVLRSSSRHNIPTLFSWAVKSLETLWPNSLDAITSTYRPHAAESIILARNFKIPSVLPHAMYELIRGTDPSRWHMLTYTYESIDPDSKALVRRKMTLHPMDVRLLHSLRERFDALWANAILATPNEIHDECIGPNKWNSMHCTPLFDNCKHDPLVGLALLGGLTLPWCAPVKLSFGVFKDQNGQNILREDTTEEQDFALLRRTSIAWSKMNVCNECVAEMARQAVAERTNVWNMVLEEVQHPHAPVPAAAALPPRAR